VSKQSLTCKGQGKPEIRHEIRPSIEEEVRPTWRFLYAGTL
jgi:hypothetical protein